MIHFVVDLWTGVEGDERPSGLDPAITLGGLLSHRSRFKPEWEAVKNDQGASYRFMRWVYSNRPDNGEGMRVAQEIMQMLEVKQ